MGLILMQAFHYETDDTSSFLSVIDTVCRVTFPIIKSDYVQLFISTLERGFNNGRKWIGPEGMSCTDPKGWSRPKKFFICTIKDYKPDAESEYPNIILINKHEEIVTNLERLLSDDPNFKKPLEGRFIARCGQGYTDWFMSSDGDVGIGYCASYRPSGGWNCLDISLTHIYYGK